jgi:iron complex transport system substrate-binding protein
MLRMIRIKLSVASSPSPGTRGEGWGEGFPEFAASLARRLMRRASLVALCLPVLATGCKQAPPPKPAGSTATTPTIASLVPAATDLLVGMNAADHLIAVSNYDLDPQISRLPKVGDYETIDWEKLASLHPNLLITDYAPNRTPAGMTDRMRQLNIRPLNLKFDRLSDIYDAAEALGEACNQPDKAAAVLAITKRRIDLIHARIAADDRVPAVIVTGAAGTDFAGRNNYLNDLLNSAGGQNAITSDGFPMLDREAIAALRPQVILHLLPGADAAAREKIAKFWTSFPDIPAVKLHRVYLFTERYVLMPGAHVGELATRFAGALHPEKENLSETSIVKATP